MSKVQRYVGYIPYPHQQYVHNGITKYGIGTGHIHCVKAKRQIGKSYIIINELLRISINHKNTTSCCLSPTLNQARKIYKEILKVTNNTNIISKKNDSLLEIELINKSVIVFKSAEQKEGLRGYTFNGILCIDEAAYINDEVYSIIRPTVDVHKAPILMVSTPKFRLGFFFQHFQMGLSEEYNNKISSYDLCKFDTSALLDKDSLELYRKMLPKNMFITEYLGEFLDSDSSVFSGFKECINLYKNNEYKELYVGIDWGSGTGSDYTVITGINEHNEQVFVESFNNKTTTQQIEYISEYLKLYSNKIKCIMAEVNGLGRPLCDNLKEKIKKIPIVEWTTTNNNKTEMINRLQVAFEQKSISLVDDDKQTAQLSMYECTYNMKTGNLTFNAPNGANDDMVMALLIAFECKRSKNKKGMYEVYIV